MYLHGEHAGFIKCMTLFCIHLCIHSSCGWNIIINLIGLDRNIVLEIKAGKLQIISVVSYQIFAYPISLILVCFLVQLVFCMITSHRPQIVLSLDFKLKTKWMCKATCHHAI